MKYLIVGIGGVGGAIASFLLNQNKDVTLAVRKTRKAYLMDNGLEITSDIIGHKNFSQLKIIDIENYNDQNNDIQNNEKFDIIFVCVKYYHLKSVIGALQDLSDQNTVIIPLLNVYGTGEELQKTLINRNVIDGCLYIVSYLRDNSLVQMGKYFKVIYGKRKDQNLDKHLINNLKVLEKDLKESEIHVLYSDNIEKDAYEKYIFISACAAATIYYNCDCGTIRITAEYLETFTELVKENIALAQKLGILINDSFVYDILAILNKMDPKSSTSAKLDWDNGNQTEVEGLIYNVLKNGEKLELKMATYEKVSEELKRQSKV